MQTDNYSQSRYLLTFASAEVCKEWWTLIQSEYPNQGTRNGPQLFAFSGDDFPSKPSTNKNFEQLKTKWFYTQFGDATGTGGRHQDIIPLQGWNGQSTGGGGGGSKEGEGEGKDTETGELAGGKGGFNMDALAESLQNVQAIIEKNNEQIAQLSQNQAQSQKRMERMERLFEKNAQTMLDSHLQSQQQSRELGEKNAKQFQALSESNLKIQQHNRELSRENAELLRELQNQRTQQQQRPAQTPTKSNTDGEVGQTLSSIQCSHDVHPPPRKIDKQLVGYAYGQDPPKRVKSKGAKQPDTPKRELVLTNR